MRHGVAVGKGNVVLAAPQTVRTIHRGGSPDV